ncbi:MAG: hypothetical protein LBT31_06710 [Synergistaceae bacterium]|jgi:hypothetical protein|nr:hypothetical protein [Synergistaceae bacterium]
MMKTTTKTSIDKLARGAFAVLLALVFGAGTVFAGSTVYKSNVLTGQHVILNGTHVAVVPPAGSRQSSDFTGFEITSRNIRYVISEKSASFAQIAGTITREGLEADGVKVSDISDVVLNEKPAKLVLGSVIKKDELEEDTRVVLLVLGNERLSVYIYGYYPESDKSAQGALRNSILSAVLEPKQRTTANADGYSLSSSGTEFKFVDEVAGTRYFTIDGKPIAEAASDAIYMSMTHDQDVQPADRPDFAADLFAKYLSSYKFEAATQKDVNIGGLQGIELTADLETNETRTQKTASGGAVRRKIPAKGFMTVLFDEGKTYSFEGIAVKNANSFLSQFAKITSTFRK